MMDPYRPYAVSFIELVARRFGIRTVAYYTHQARMRRYRPDFPTLGGPLVAASYLVEEDELEPFADMVRDRHDIVGVIPYMEPSLAGAARLAERLELSWAQPGVLERFRDKGALKEHLRSVPDGPRINMTRRVAGPDDVLEAVLADGYNRYVLKPNDGYGNSRIGFFDATTGADELARYFADVGADVLMEEFIDGPELFVDGQVDETGEAVVYSVWRFIRAEANGRANVSMGQHTVRRHDPLFEICAEYARAVMRASGLRRSPFHLELKVDSSGPCLIEVGARLAGGYLAHLDDAAHGSLDSLGIAAHHYLFDTPVEDYRLDWDHYDSVVMGLINGVSTVDGRIWRLEGMAQAEAAPGFLRWTRTPSFGDRITPTVDILSQPWQAAGCYPDEEAYLLGAQAVRDAVRINESRGVVLPRLGRYASLSPAAMREARGLLARGNRIPRFDDV
jgi:hypothetical protein